MRHLLSFFLLFAWCLPLVTPFTAFAESEPTKLLTGFNPNAILSDDDLFSLDGWSAERIQRFLVSKGSGLATLKLIDIDGTEQRPADIIWRVAGSYKMNPQYLLVLLQKEQSLVEDPTPSQKQLDWATGYAVCDSCSMNDPSIQSFRGFANQIEYAAKQHRERYLQQLYTRGTTIAGFAPGKTSYVNGKAITPTNQATAMLYSYTPHLHGNQNVWKIWMRWFSRSLPDGTLVVKAGTTDRYIIRQGERRPLSAAVSASLMSDTSKFVSVDADDLELYPEGAAIQFPNYSLVELPDGTRYLLSGEEKRKIVSTRAFTKLGFQEDDVIAATESDLESYKDGPDLTERSRYPLGQLAKDAKGVHWYIENDERRQILHPSLLKLYFRGRPARTLSATELSRFPVGEPYRLKDGELVRGVKEPAVYVIEFGKRRAIPSEEVFLGMGYAWNNVLTVPDALLEAHELGEPLDAPWKAPATLVESPTDLPPPDVTPILSSLSL